MTQDSSWYSNLDASHWMEYLANFLRATSAISATIGASTTAFLREDDTPDQGCVLASLVQLILDPFYRTLDGFQQLIQKEWLKFVIHSLFSCLQK